MSAWFDEAYGPSGIAYQKHMTPRDLLMGTANMPEWIGRNIVLKPGWLGARYPLSIAITVRS